MHCGTTNESLTPVGLVSALFRIHCGKPRKFVKDGLTNPAFQCDRRACFPALIWHRPSEGAQRRRWDWAAQSGPIRATSSHAHRALSRANTAAGEHRTFSAVSTAAHSSPVGGSHHRTSAPESQRRHRLEESLRNFSGSYFDTHRPNAPTAQQRGAFRTEPSRFRSSDDLVACQPGAL